MRFPKICDNFFSNTVKYLPIHMKTNLLGFQISAVSSEALMTAAILHISTMHFKGLSYKEKELFIYSAAVFFNLPFPKTTVKKI